MGQNTSAEKTKDHGRWAVKTLGGLQFWADVHFFHQWHIQWNVRRDTYRLLDGEDYQYASGTFEECLQELENIKRSRRLPPMSGKAVVLVHGLARSRRSMAPMRKAFQEAGYQVFLFGYPSTQLHIAEAADLLARAVGSLQGMEEINFVGHSLGGLIIRAFLAKHKASRVRRVVMLGVPNLGADLADRLKGLKPYQAIFGPAGQELVTDPDGFIAKLPAPPCEFAIIAGARGNRTGFNPLVPGDDDGTVAVSSTRLPGAADFMTVKCLHSFLMYSNEAIAASVRFIRTGSLRESGQREPIPSDSGGQPQKTDVATRHFDGGYTVPFSKPRD